MAANQDVRSFAARYAPERPAVLDVDVDVDAIVRLLGGDLSAPHQLIQLAEAVAELGRDDAAPPSTLGVSSGMPPARCSAATTWGDSSTRWWVTARPSVAGPQPSPTYTAAVKILERTRGAGQTAGELDAFAPDLAVLRERQRRRPALIGMLTRAGLG